MLIFLIGFMGSGKSYTGKRLARLMDYAFIDLDEFLEEGEHRSISTIFSEEGEAYFRKLESEYLRKLEGRQKLVIATGGGTPCQPDNLEWMKRNGLIIYLSAAPDLLARRLQKETSQRPLIAGLDKPSLMDFIDKKLQERARAYEEADVIIFQEDGIDVAELIAKRLFGR